MFRLRFESCYGGFPKICAIQVLKNVNIANYVSVLNEQDQLTFSLQLWNAFLLYPLMYGFTFINIRSNMMQINEKTANTWEHKVGIIANFVHWWNPRKNFQLYGCTWKRGILHFVTCSWSSLWTSSIKMSRLCLVINKCHKDGKNCTTKTYIGRISIPLISLYQLYFISY